MENSKVIISRPFLVCRAPRQKRSCQTMKFECMDNDKGRDRHQKATDTCPVKNARTSMVCYRMRDASFAQYKQCVGVGGWGRLPACFRGPPGWSAAPSRPHWIYAGGFLPSHPKGLVGLWPPYLPLVEWTPQAIHREAVGLQEKWGVVGEQEALYAN